MLYFRSRVLVPGLPIFLSLILIRNLSAKRSIGYYTVDKLPPHQKKDWRSRAVSHRAKSSVRWYTYLELVLKDDLDTKKGARSGSPTDQHPLQ